MHAYDIPDDIQIGDFKKASREESHRELERRRMESNNDRWVDRHTRPSQPVEDAEVKKLLRLPHFITPTPPRPVMDSANAPRFLKKLH